MIAGVLLAAGNSSRFGSDKLRQALTGDICIGEAAANNLRAAVDYCVAVVPATDCDLSRRFAAHHLQVIHAPPDDIGIGTSLACGVRALPPIDGVIVALADMPFVHPATIRSIAAALAAGASIAAPRYRGRRGHPIGFHARWRKRLENLCGDIGARSLLQQHAQEIVYVDCADAGVSIDIDAPEDMRGIVRLRADDVV